MITRGISIMAAEPKIKKFKVSSLFASTYNPRTISQESLDGLTASLKRFGCVEPIVVNIRGNRNRIIGGHQRLKALKSLKVQTVYCVAVNLPPHEEKLLNITLNNPEIQGQFNADLGKVITSLSKDMKDKSILLNTKILRLQEEILAKYNKQKYQFRPGSRDLKNKTTAGKFWLKKKDLSKFIKYENFILDFSGGKDSTLALAWLATYFQDKKIYAVYADTGVEFPGMGDHIIEVCKFFKVEPVILKPMEEWWAWLRKEGRWPSLIFRKCQTVFIHNVTKAFRRKFPKENTLLLDGSRATQSVRGSQKTIDSPVGSIPKYNAYHPCFNLTDEETRALLGEINSPLWEGYKQGFVRSACWCCPGQCGLQAAALHKNYPGLCDVIRRWEKRIGPLRPMNNKKFDDIVRAGQEKLKK